MSDWHLYTADGAQGPYPEEQLRAWLADGSITRDWHAWREGLGEWQMLGNTPEFFPPAAGESATPAPAPAVRVVTPDPTPAAPAPAVAARRTATVVRRPVTPARTAAPRPVTVPPDTDGDEFNTIVMGIKLSLLGLIPLVGNLICLYLLVQRLHPDETPWKAMAGWIVVSLIPGVNIVAGLYFLYLIYDRIGGRFLVGSFLPGLTVVLIAALLFTH